MTEQKLKPCPFCGGKAKIFHYEQGDYYNEAFSVYCDNCGASLEDYDFEEQAIEHWNKRVEVEE